jgi:hypothetical protein
MTIPDPLPSDLVLDNALERAQKGKRTVSELLFEAFCDGAQIDCEPIPTEMGVKTPDFELSIGGQMLIVEVKELTEKNGGPGRATSEIAGARIREKIRQCAGQLKTRTAGRHAGMLVLYREGGLGYFDVHVTAAMYGTMVIDIAVPLDHSVRPYIVGKRFGQGRRMTPDHNTSISAVGVVFRGGPNWDFDLLVYHNAYAAVPIEPRLLTQHGIRQFHMDFDSGRWVSSKPGRP